MPEIVVVGSAERLLRADRASLRMSWAAVDADAETAVREATERHSAWVDEAEQLVASGAAERFTAEPIVAWANSWRDELNVPRTEHRATVTVTVDLADVSHVGELTTRWAAAGVEVQTAWRVAAETRVALLRELRAEAVADAREAAADFAVALGGEHPRIVRLREGAGHASEARAMPMPMAAAASGAIPVPEVTVPEIGVRVDIEATFGVEDDEAPLGFMGDEG